jgi:membrane-bound lytic murein transglycosylase D
MIIIVLFVLGFWLWPEVLVATPPEAPPPCLTSPPITLPNFQLPSKITLCGEEVPLSNPDVYEDVDREFTVVVWSRAQSTLWIKRAHRYFPIIERKLRDNRLPEDLKYVALVESDLRSQVRSAAGAMGPWQFMKPTANRFALKTENNIDDRLDFIAATSAALKYLASLHHLFNNWTLAIAAYNCGEGRVQQAIKEQGLTNYYQLRLPEETERYIPRILAAKILLSDPACYGYCIPPDQLYPPLKYDQVDFTLDREVHLRQIAEACGSYYKVIKRLNPRLRSSTLTPGSYRLNVPAGTASRFYEIYSKGQLNTGLLPTPSPPAKSEVGEAEPEKAAGSGQ